MALRSKHVALKTEVACKRRDTKRKLDKIAASSSRKLKTKFLKGDKKGNKKGDKQAEKGAPSQEEFGKWLKTKPPPGEEDAIVEMIDPKGRMHKWNWCKCHKQMVHAFVNGIPHNSTTCREKDMSPLEQAKQAKAKRYKRVQVQAVALRVELEDIGA